MPKLPVLKPRVTVPIHAKDIPLRVLKSIIRQAGLTNDDFEALLD